MGDGGVGAPFFFLQPPPAARSLSLPTKLKTRAHAPYPSPSTCIAPRRIASLRIFFLEAAFGLPRPRLVDAEAAPAFANHHRPAFTAKKASTSVPNRAMTALAGWGG